MIAHSRETSGFAGLMTLSALGKPEQTAALGALANSATCSSNDYVGVCLRVDAEHLAEMSQSASAMTAGRGGLSHDFVLDECDAVAEQECECFVVTSGP